MFDMMWSIPWALACLTALIVGAFFSWSIMKKWKARFNDLEQAHDRLQIEFRGQVSDTKKQALKIAKMEDEKESDRIAVTDWKKKHAQLERDLQEVKKEKLDLEGQSEIYLTKLIDLDTALEETTSSIQEMQGENDGELDELREQYEMQLKGMQRRLIQSERQSEDYRLKLTNSAQSAEKWKSEVKTLIDKKEEKYIVIKRDRNLIAAELSDWKVKYQSKANECVRLVREYKLLKQEQKAQYRELLGLRSESVLLDSHIESLQGQINVVNSENERKGEALLLEKTKLRDVKDQFSALQSEWKTLQESHQLQGQKLVEAKRLAEERAVQLDAAEAVTKNLSEERKVALDQLEQWRIKWAEKSELLNIELQRVLALEASLGKEKKEGERLQDEIGELEQKISSEVRERGLLAIDLNNWKLRLSKKEREADELNSELVDRTDSLQDLELSHKELGREMYLWKSKAESLMEELSEKQITLRKTSESLLQLEVSLKEEVEKRQLMVKRLSGELQSKTLLLEKLQLKEETWKSDLQTYRSMAADLRDESRRKQMEWSRSRSLLQSELDTAQLAKEALQVELDSLKGLMGKLDNLMQGAKGDSLSNQNKRSKIQSKELPFLKAVKKRKDKD